MPELTQDVVDTLLPRNAPPSIVPEGVPRDFFEARLHRLESEEQKLIFLWMTAFQAIAERSQLYRQYPGFQYSTYGFVPVSGSIDNQSQIAGGYVFGIAVELEQASGDPSQELDWIGYQDLRIPCIFNRRRIVLDVANPLAPTGTGACWAHSCKTKIKPAADGALTAEHVVANIPLTSSVSMSDPGNWYLGDRGTCKIDAALIVRLGGGCIPLNAGKLPVEYNPQSKSMVEIHGAVSGVIPTKITHTQLHPTYLSGRHPMRVFLDKHGQAGDSGALVKDKSTGRGVGIYMGRDPIPPSLGAAGVYEGVAQYLPQVKHELELDLYL
jgi:hypothetical protein